jgi:3-hydroxybutyryl-CoA dehydratase
MIENIPLSQKYIVGTKHQYSKRFSFEDVNAFALLTGDLNPLHINREAAAASIFKQVVVHGMLTSALFSSVFGTIYPGKGSIYLGQTLKFLKPVFLDQTITAYVELKEVNEEKKMGTFATYCINEKGETVITGEAKILLP